MPSPKAAVAETVSAAPSRFSVQASAEPGVMPRLLELFAKRGVVPDRWHSTLARQAMTLSIDIEVAGLEGDTVVYVANCMRQIAGVELVLAV
jgi:acetolactate synthase regulatory subunit